MPATITTLEFRTHHDWRAWLEAHHAISHGLWVVFLKGSASSSSMSYDEAVREALCFGWVDSLVKRLDDERYARKFTPRKPGSAWADSNRKRWAELDAAGLLAPAGRAAAPTEAAAVPPPIPEMIDELDDALRQHGQAWQTFRGLAPSHRRQYIAWIHAAKRPETRAKRIREAIARLSAGQRLGVK